MDFMFAYFPIFKGVFMLLLSVGLVYFVRTKRYKVAGWYFFLLALVWWYAPVKYDGTKTATHHKEQVRQVTAIYDEVTTEKVVTKKKTFAERLAEENARSLTANNKIKEEIVK